MDVEATHATTGATGSGPKGAFPPFDPASFAPQLLWFAIAFGLLYYVMSKMALPKVGAIIEDRRRAIASDLDAAQALRTQSEAAEAEYEATFAQARARSKTIAQDTRDRLAGETEARRKALEAELGDRLASAEATIRTATEASMSNVRTIASEAAAAIVERLTGRVPDRAALDAALQRTVAS